MSLRTLTVLAALCSLLVPAVTVAQDGLQAAYQKEYTFLEGEKRALATQKKKQAEDAARRHAKVKAEIAGLERRLLELRSQSDTLDTALREGDTAQTLAEQGDDVVSEVLLRASDTLQRHGLEAPPSVSAESTLEARDAAIAKAFTR